MRVTGKMPKKGVVRITKVLPCFRHLDEREIEDGGGGEKLGRGGIGAGARITTGVEVQ